MSEWLKRIRRWIYRKAVRWEGSPRRIAFAIAFGAFWGFMIPPSGQLITGIPLSILFGLNPIIFTIGSLVTNPFTYLPAYLFSCKVGELFIRHICNVDLQYGIHMSMIKSFIAAIADANFSEIWHSMRELALCWVVGGVIVGLSCAVIGYYLALFVVIEARKVRELRRLKKLSLQQILFKKIDLANILPHEKKDEEPKAEEPADAPK